MLRIQDGEGGVRVPFERATGSVAPRWHGPPPFHDCHGRGHVLSDARLCSGVVSRVLQLRTGRGHPSLPRDSSPYSSVAFDGPPEALGGTEDMIITSSRRHPSRICRPPPRASKVIAGGRPRRTSSTRSSPR